MESEAGGRSGCDEIQAASPSPTAGAERAIAPVQPVDDERAHRDRQVDALGDGGGGERADRPEVFGIQGFPPG